MHAASQESFTCREHLNCSPPWQPHGCQKKRTDIGILGNQAKNANAKCARIGIVQSAAVRTAVRRPGNVLLFTFHSRRFGSTHQT